MVEIIFELDTSPVGKLGTMPRKAIPKALEYAAEDMRSFLAQNSPIDRGFLRQWYISSLSDTEAHIRTPADYAVYQDQGTRAHMIRPVRAKALHWDHYFSKGHMVSGIKAKHFVDRSFNQLQPLVPGYFLRAFEEVQG